MNEIQLKNNNGNILAGSREVAEKFGKRHTHVLDTIKGLRTELSTAEFSALFTLSNYKASNGKMNDEYLMNRDGFSLLAMGFTGKEALHWKLKYIEAFNKMEQELKPKVPTTYKEALLETVRLLEENEKLAIENAELKPKAEFFDAVASSEDAIEIGKVAKVLNYPGIGRNKLFEILRERGVLMRDNIPYQKYIDNGCFRTIEQKYSIPTGETRISIKTLVYQKGVDYIRKIIEAD